MTKTSRKSLTKMYL